MDVSALWKNLRRIRSITPSLWQAGKVLLWTYSGNRWISLLLPERMKLRFVYPKPIGSMALTLRHVGTGDAYIFGEVFDLHHYDYDLDPAPRTILDLGGHVGMTSLFFSRRYPEAEIACVEPIPTNFALLLDNVKQNQVKAALYLGAIAPQNGEVEMAMAEKDYDHQVAGVRDDRPITGQTFKVGAFSVGSIMAQLGWERISLMKMDIEGYEKVVLREQCEWLEWVDQLCIECHQGFGEQDLQEIADTWGFEAPDNSSGVWVLKRKA